MEHFSTVSAICRASMKSPSTALLNHIKKLIRALEKDNEIDQANSLREIIENTEIVSEIQPSRITLSKYSLIGENMPKGIKPPVDKESGNYLAEIYYPESLRIKQPTFDNDLQKSISSLLEEWTNSELLRNNGIDPAYSLMLFGMPGTGKTLLANYLASEMQLPLVVAKLDGLLSSFLGTTARNISSLFNFANRYKCILLLDEFDAIAKLRDDPNELGELKRVVNTLLQCLDERNKIGYTIAITNHDALLDPAIWRRFNLRIEIPKPCLEVRNSILKNLIEDKLHLNDLQISFLAKMSDNYSGSDLNNLINFINRKKVINPEKFDFMNVVIEFIKLNANLTKQEFVDSITKDDDSFIKFLRYDENFKFNQIEIAELTNVKQPTISRILKK